jgi:CRISPR system Cascade subunit CasC
VNYLNLHMLFTLSAANPNRDDAGSPKTLGYGGATRSRIASQAMTRPKRRTFEADYAGDATQRSALIAQHITTLAEKLIAEAGDTITPDQATKLHAAAAKTITGLTAKPRDTKPGKPTKKTAAAAPADTLDDDPDTATDTEATEAGPKATLIWLAESEIRAAATKLVTDFIARNDLALDPTDFINGRQTDSLTIAAFGRMFAQRPDLNVEAAIQRAHAFTSHATVNEVDYFTTVDDLRTADRGAGHLGIAELTGGVYYWHANVDIRQLLTTWTGFTAADARDRLTALFEALFLALPAGRQNTTAHHSIPAVVLAVPAKLPASLQTAFETPIRPQQRTGGFLTPTIDALFDEHQRTAAALPSRFATGRHAGTATISSDTARGSEPATSLDDLAAWCADHVLASAQTLR